MAAQVKRRSKANPFTAEYAENAEVKREENIRPAALGVLRDLGGDQDNCYWEDSSSFSRSRRFP
jgi:hypothetical protein